MGTAVLLRSTLVLALMAATGLAPAAAATTEPAPALLTSWYAGQEPDALAVGPAGDVVVVGWEEDVRTFSPHGTLLDQWTWDDNIWGQAQGVAVSPAGDLYVSDMLDDVVRRFDSQGTLLDSWGDEEEGAGALAGPRGLAHASVAGELYVADHGNHRVAVFTGNGSFLRSIDGGSDSFRYPEDVAVSRDGDVFVLEATWDKRVWRYDATGALLGHWGSPGSYAGQLSDPMGLTVDGAGAVYVADAGNDRVQKFELDSTLLTLWETGGDYPSDVAVDDQGDVYVANTGTSEVQRFGVRPPRPDGRIRLGTGTLVGNDVYNATGVDQTRRATVRPGKTAVFTISLQNDAVVPDRIRVKAKRSTPAFKVVYRNATEDVITAAVTAGTWRTPQLAPGKAVTVKAVVKVRATARRGATLRRPLTSTSTSSPEHLDVVRFVVVAR